MHSLAKSSFLVSSLLFAAAAGTAALAHHGWGSYDVDKKFTIAAPVETLEWGNPHVMLKVKHQGATWDAVLAPPFRMQARGLSEDMIKKGTTVSLEGYPSTRSANEMRAERISVGGKIVELR